MFPKLLELVTQMPQSNEEAGEVDESLKDIQDGRGGPGCGGSSTARRWCVRFSSGGCSV